MLAGKIYNKERQNDAYLYFHSHDNIIIFKFIPYKEANEYLSTLKMTKYTKEYDKKKKKKSKNRTTGLDSEDLAG